MAGPPVARGFEAKGNDIPTSRYWPETSASQLSLAYIPYITIARRKGFTGAIVKTRFDQRSHTPIGVLAKTARKGWKSGKSR